MAAGNKRQVGGIYEQKAADYLSRQGFRIIEHNFYSRFGEIDLIAKDGKYLVFIEVKYRRDSACGTPLEAVTLKKQKRICRLCIIAAKMDMATARHAALMWLQSKGRVRRCILKVHLILYIDMHHIGIVGVHGCRK